MNVVFRINSAAVDAAKFPVCAAKILRKTSSADELRITLAPDAQTVPDIDDTIEVFVGSTRKFFGRITKIPKRRAAEKMASEIVAKSPWRDLEETVYQQYWKRAVGGESASVLRSRVALGQNAAGGKIKVSEQIREIALYAASCGAQLTVGTIDTDSDMLLDEARDISCAQAIARTLKWAPNSVAYFDYATDGYPKLEVRKRPALPSETIDISKKTTLSASVAERPDLRVDCVSVKYEQENEVDGETWLAVSEEKYPQDAQSNSRRAIVMTVDLDGAKSSSSTYKIVCGTVQPNSVQWWRKHVPSLADESDMTVVESARETPTYARELLVGSIVAGMNFQTLSDRITAKVKYTTDDGSIVTKNVAANILSTNAVSGTYTIWKTSQFAEEKPSGLAEAVYKAVSDAQYEGSVKILGALEKSFLGKRIGISDSQNPDWADIGATVVQTEENLADGTTLVKFGPPKHLYPDNMEELFRINRNRTVSSDISTRTTGKISGKSDEPTQTKAEINGGEGDAVFDKFVIGASGGEQPDGIELDPADLDDGELAKMREIYICHNGYLATAKVLMSEPKYVE